MTRRRSLQFIFKSGDVLVFDPSTNAGILLVLVVLMQMSFQQQLMIWMLMRNVYRHIREDFKRYRFGVQCRVKLDFVQGKMN